MDTPAPRAARRPRRPPSAWAGPAALFGALALAAWWKPLLAGRALFYDMLYRLFFPNHAFFRRSILSGSFPLWNPHQYSGVPYAANLQSAVFYPFTYLGLWLDFPRTAAVNVWAHTALAGAFMYWLARALGRSKTGAAVSGIAFALNGCFALRYAYLSNVDSYVWLPLVLLPFHARDWPLRRAWACAGAALALQLFAGHPQYLMYGALAAAVCAAFAEDRRRWLEVGAGAGALFLALAAVQLVLTARLAAESVRSPAGHAPGFGFDWAMANSVRPAEALLMLLAPQWNAYFVPRSGDPHLVGFYFGPLLLLCAGLAFRGPARTWRPFAAIAALGFLLALGRHFPLYPRLYALLPMLRAVRFPAQALFLACFGVSVLAGAGVDLASPRARRWLPALAAADLLLFAWRGQITADPSVYRADPPAAAALGAAAGLERVMLTPRTRESQRMSGRDADDAWLRFKDALFPNFPTAYGLYAADGHQELRYARYEAVLDAVDRDPRSPWIDVLGIKYVLSFWGMPAKFRLAGRTATQNVYLNPARLPKAYAVFRTRRVRDDEALDLVRRAGSALVATTALLPDGPELDLGCRAASTPARVLDYRPGLVRVSVDAPCPGWLVLADAYDAGWVATVNRAPTPVLRANLTQRAVRIPGGPSQVEFLYRPAWLRPLATLSAAGWLTVALLLIL